MNNPELAPVPVIRSEELRQLGQNLDKLFMQYVSDRRIAELKWLRNLRQYLGLYDPEIEKRQARIARERGFTVGAHALHLYCHCVKADCPNRKLPQG